MTPAPMTNRLIGATYTAYLGSALHHHHAHLMNPTLSTSLERPKRSRDGALAMNQSRTIPAEGREFEIRAATWAVVVVATAWTWFLVTKSWYRADDFLDLNTARQDGLNWHYLSLSLFGHFIPGFRLFYWILAVPLGSDYRWVEVFAVALFALSAWLFAQCCFRLFGARWGVVLATAFFGTSLLLTPSVLWFASLLETLPAIATSLGCVYAFLRWRRSSRIGWIFLIAASFSIGLSFYEIMLVFPIVLVVLELLFLGAASTIQGNVRAVVRQWPVWLALLIPGVAYGWYYLANGYSSGSPSPTVSVALGTFLVAWLQAIGPSLFGYSVLLRPPPSLAIVFVGQLIIGLGIVVALYHDLTRTVRALIFVAVCFVAYLTPIAFTRAGSYGTGVGRDYLYLTPFIWLLPLSALLAWYGVSTEAAPRGVKHGRSVPPVRRTAVGVTVGVGVIIVLSVNGQWSLTQSYGQSSRAVRSVAGNFSAGVARLDGRHADYYVYDAKLPQDSMPLPLIIPYDLLSNTIGPMSGPVAFSGNVRSSTSGYVVLPDGRLVPGTLRGRTNPSSTQLGAPTGSFCVPSHTNGVRATFSLNPGLPFSLWMIGIESLSGGPGQLSVTPVTETGSALPPELVDAVPGHASYLWLPPTSVSKVIVAFSAGGPFCGKLTIGTPSPDPAAARAKPPAEAK